MRKLKQMIGVVLTMVMVIAMSMPVLPVNAAQSGKKIVIEPSPTVPSLEGRTFKAYRVLEAEDAGNDQIAYTVPEKLKNFYAEELGVDISATAFSYKVAEKIGKLGGGADDNKALFEFGKKLLKAAKAAEMDGTEGRYEDHNYVFSGLQAGYYIIEDVTGVNNNENNVISALLLQTNVEEQTIAIKADLPKIDKNILEEDEPVKANDASVGDTVTYVLTSNVPDMRGYDTYKFVVSDTLSDGLTYDEGSLKVEIGEKPIDAGKYDLEVNGQNIRIVFHNFIQYANQPGAEIKITYTATINEHAVIGTDSNDNTAKLLYSNNPNKETNGDSDDFQPNDPVGETPEAVVHTFITGLEFEKVNRDDKLLAGAEFKLTGETVNKVEITTGYEFVENESGEYYKLSDGSYTKTAPTDETKDKYDPAGKKYAKQALKTTTWNEGKDSGVTATTDNNGTIKFSGLSAGKYTLEELKSPDGYNLLTDKIFIEIECIPQTNKETGEYDGTCAWSGTYKIGESGEEKALQFDAGTGVITGLKIVNDTGMGLPSTGGIGTTIFYVVGGILVVAAAILLFVKRNMRKEN